DMEVSALGFGGAEIGYDGVSQGAVTRLLNAALDAGLNVIDTAECYADSETLIGRAASGRRREFYLFTKVGHAAGWGREDWRSPPCCRTRASVAWASSPSGRWPTSPGAAAHGHPRARITARIGSACAPSSTTSSPDRSTTRWPRRYASR